MNIAKVRWRLGRVSFLGDLETLERSRGRPGRHSGRLIEAA